MVAFAIRLEHTRVEDIPARMQNNIVDRRAFRGEGSVHPRVYKDAAFDKLALAFVFCVEVSRYDKAAAVSYR